MSLQNPSCIGVIHDLEVSGIKVNLCSDVEFFAWTHECLECSIGTFLAEKYLPIHDTPISTISFCDLLIFERYTGSKNSRIIKKKNSIIRKYITQITKNSLILDRSRILITYDESSIMMRMCRFLGDKHIRKDI